MGRPHSRGPRDLKGRRPSDVRISGDERARLSREKAAVENSVGFWTWGRLPCVRFRPDACVEHTLPTSPSQESRGRARETLHDTPPPQVSLSLGRAGFAPLCESAAATAWFCSFSRNSSVSRKSRVSAVSARLGHRRSVLGTSRRKPPLAFPSSKRLVSHSASKCTAGFLKMDIRWDKASQRAPFCANLYTLNCLKGRRVSDAFGKRLGPNARAKVERLLACDPPQDARSGPLQNLGRQGERERERGRLSLEKNAPCA